MDELRPWWGNYFRLKDVFSVISQLPKELYDRPKCHEIYITWALGVFLSWRESVEYLIGFPTYEKEDNPSLLTFIEGNIAIDDDNFDTVMTINGVPNKVFLVQIKRYRPSGKFNTKSFFEFMLKKLERYGDARNLNVIFDTQVALRLDFAELKRLCQNVEFKVASITLYCVDSKDRMPLLFGIYPTYSAAYWKPTPKEYNSTGRVSPSGRDKGWSIAMGFLSWAIALLTVLIVSIVIAGVIILAGDSFQVKIPDGIAITIGMLLSLIVVGPWMVDKIFDLLNSYTSPKWRFHCGDRGNDLLRDRGWRLWIVYVAIAAFLLIYFYSAFMSRS